MAASAQINGAATIQNEGLRLIGQLIEDIRKSSKITEQRKLELIEILKKNGKRWIKLRIEFKKKVKDMINQLLTQTSEIDISIACKEEDIPTRKHFYERYRRLLNSVVGESERYAQEIQNILLLITNKDAKLSSKYKLFLAGTVTTALFGGSTIISLTVLHLLPSTVCAFTLPPVGIAVLASGSVIIFIITIWLLYKTIRAKRYDWKAVMGDSSEEFIENLSKYFPFLVDFFYRESTLKLTSEQLQQILIQSLQCIEVDEDTWLHNDTLEDFRAKLESTLLELVEDHSWFEESCRSVTE